MNLVKLLLAAVALLAHVKADCADGQVATDDAQAAWITTSETICYDSDGTEIGWTGEYWNGYYNTCDWNQGNLESGTVKVTSTGPCYDMTYYIDGSGTNSAEKKEAACDPDSACYVSMQEVYDDCGASYLDDIWDSPCPTPAGNDYYDDEDDDNALGDALGLDETYHYDGSAYNMLIPLYVIVPVGLVLLFLNFRRLEKYAAGKTETGGIDIEMNQKKDDGKSDPVEAPRSSNSTKKPLPSVMFIPKHYFKCFALYSLICVIFTAAGDGILRGCDGQTMAESAGIRALADYLFLGFACAEVIHCYCMLLFMFQKQHFTVHDLVHVEEDSKFDEEGATVIFARKLDCVGCLLTSTVGFVIDIVQFVIDMAGMIGPDLSMFFFPAPFYQFWKAKLLIRSIRVNGAQLKFSAVQADAYFLFLWVKLYNFFSWGLYSKYCAANMYEKWLDSKLTWKDSAPNGFTDDNFQIFLDKLSFCEKMQKMAGVFFLGAIPGFQPVLMYWAYTKRLPHLKIGSVHPNFGPDFTLSGFFSVWLSTFCGLCGSAKLKRYADANIRFDMRQSTDRA